MAKSVSCIGDGGISDWKLLAIELNFCQTGTPGLLGVPPEDGKRVAQKIGAAVIAQTPLGRVGNDTDLQGAAVYLASDASRRVTGQYIAVDGGASIA